MLKNQACLSEAGLSYPMPAGPHPGNGATIAKLSANKLEQHFSGGTHTLILSHEDLLPQPPLGKQLAKLAKRMNIKVQIVAFLRPFSEFIYGDYSQFMKQNFNTHLKDRMPYGGRSFEVFAVERSRAMPVAGWLTAWSQHFPSHPLILESHLLLRATLNRLLSLPASFDWNLPASETNPSLRVADCEALAKALMDPSAEAPALSEMFKEAFHKVAAPDPGRTSERDTWIEALFLDRNRNTFEKFGFDNRKDTSQPFL